MHASSHTHASTRAPDSYSATVSSETATYADDSVWEYAPRRARVLAFLIDQLLLFSFFFTLVAVASFEIFLTSDYGEVDPPERASIAGISIVAAIVPLWALYYVLTWRLAGRSLGQFVMGLRVVRRDGAPIGLGRAVVRMVALAISAMTLHLLAITMLFTQERRTTHDVIAGTVVVSDDPLPWNDDGAAW